MLECNPCFCASIPSKNGYKSALKTIEIKCTPNVVVQNNKKYVLKVPLSFEWAITMILSNDSKGNTNKIAPTAS